MKKALLNLVLASILALGGTALSATPLAPAQDKAQAATYSKCYSALNGERWCYRNGCNFYEYWFQGCRDGWVRSNVWYA